MQAQRIFGTLLICTDFFRDAIFCINWGKIIFYFVWKFTKSCLTFWKIMAFQLPAEHTNISLYLCLSPSYRRKHPTSSSNLPEECAQAFTCWNTYYIILIFFILLWILIQMRVSYRFLCMFSINFILGYWRGFIASLLQGTFGLIRLRTQV